MSQVNQEKQGSCDSYTIPREHCWRKFNRKMEKKKRFQKSIQMFSALIDDTFLRFFIPVVDCISESKSRKWFKSQIVLWKKQGIKNASHKVMCNLTWWITLSVIMSMKVSLKLNSAEKTQTAASLKRSLLLNANNRKLHSARAEAATSVKYLNDLLNSLDVTPCGKEVRWPHNVKSNWLLFNFNYTCYWPRVTNTLWILQGLWRLQRRL